MADEQTVLDIPIVAFPPFKLRSSLIDKDPVIWVHLLEYYIVLFQKLITIYGTRSTKLSLKSQQQLTVFLKIYLHESAEESTKIFSLGAINPDIVTNTKVLKLYVFEFIKTTNLVNLGLGPEAVWDFVKVYCKLAKLNESTKAFPVTLSAVRQLVEGTVKSKINSRSNEVSMVTVIHKHLKSLVESGKFGKYDLEALRLLVGQYTQVVGTAPAAQKKRIGNANRSKGKRPANGNGNGNGSFAANFATTFATPQWIEDLEVLYNKGVAAHASTAFDIGVITILSLPVPKLSRLISVDLNVNNFKTMVRLFPLVSTVLLSDAYNRMNPGLEERLPFLSKEGRRQAMAVDFNQDDIATVIDLFPQLEISQVKRLLVDKNHDVEAVTHELLEMDPSGYGEIDHFKEFKRSVYDQDELDKKAVNGVQVHFGKRNKLQQQDAAAKDKSLKEKTLNSALRLLYDSDEDEPDDTYNDQEVTKGADSVANVEETSRTRGPRESSSLEQTEVILFQAYKKNPEVFDAAAKKSKERAALKAQVKWSDEQIQGWARMLVRQPSKFKMLDEQFNFSDISGLNRGLKQSTRYRKQRDDDDSDSDVQDLVRERESFTSRGKPRINSTVSDTNEGTASAPKEADKKSRQYDAKKKAAKANHNRKAGHDKKMAKGLV